MLVAVQHQVVKPFAFCMALAAGLVCRHSGGEYPDLLEIARGSRRRGGKALPGRAVLGGWSPDLP